MLLKKISYRIAWQFTAFVFILFMVNGGVFLAADFENGRRMAEFRLERMSGLVSQMIREWPRVKPEQLPPRLRSQVRIIDLQGHEVYSGSVFEGTPFLAEDGRSRIQEQDDEYGVFTVPLIRRGVTIGFVQVAEPERQPMRDLPRRVTLYLLVSILVSALTFVVGLFFARRNLRPAEEMMQRLEQFTQDASHELKTPLAALRSSLELALKNGKLHEGIISARDDVKVITALVDRLLELTRLDQFNIEKLTIDGTALVHETIERHRALIGEKGITLETSIDSPVLIEGDSALLRQVLTNLLSNAIKFTPAGGTIRVELTRKYLRISDTGCGISLAAQPHIFDRFFQADTSRSHGGFGLGLALVRRIVDLHDWTIGFESAEAKGTTFTVRFS